MKFRTELKIPSSRSPLDPRGRVLLLGSCFSENIGRKMKSARWNVTVNPTGVLFNPASIAITLTAAMLHPQQRESLLRYSLTRRGSAWVSWLSDASTGSLSSQECLEKCRAAFKELQVALTTADTLIITWGSAIMYSLAGESAEMVVANCHKHPSSEFIRRRATVEEIVTTTREVINSLRIYLPQLRIIITVSPVRHLADGAVENSRSKSTLLLAAEELCSVMEDVEYFPAYELLNDDLRDYRFYACDLCHPSEEAIEYVWERFCETYLTDKGRELVEQGETLTRRESHISQIPGTEEDTLFREKTREMLLKWDSENRGD